MANKTQSGASYEAILIDKITKPVNDIIDALGLLDQEFDKTANAANQASKAIGGVAKSVPKNASIKISGPLTGVQEALTKVRTAALSSGQAVSQALSSMGTTAKTVGLSLLAFSASVGFAIKKTLDLAAIAEETQNKFNIAFGTMQKQANAWAGALGRSIGRAVVDIQDFSSTFQTLLTGFGFSDKAAMDMSTTLTQLTYDLGSFNNMADEDVMQRLLSGMTGSSEAMERLGVNIKETAINTFLMQKGIDATNKDLDEQQKVLVRLAITLEATTKQQGDAQRTATSWTNQTKTLAGNIKTLASNLGQLFRNQLIGTLQNVVVIFKQLAIASKTIDADQIKQVVASVALAAGFGASLLAVGTAMTLMAGVVITVSTAISGIVAVISLGITVFTGIAASAAALPLVLLAVASAMAAVPLAFASWDGIKVFFSDISTKGSAMKQTLLDVFGTLKDGFNDVAKAAQAGEWELAFKVITATGRVAFLELADSLVEIFRDSISKGIVAGVNSAKRTLLNASSPLKAYLSTVEKLNTASKRISGAAFAPEAANSAESEGLRAARAALAEVRSEIAKLESSSDAGGIVPLAANADSLLEASKLKEKLAAAEKEAAAKEKEEARKAAFDFFTKFQTPLEQFASEINAAKKAASDLGRPDLLPRAVKAAFETYMNATKVDQPDAPRGPRTDSIVTAGAGFAGSIQGSGPVFDPIVTEQKKTNNILAESQRAMNEIKNGIGKLNQKNVVFQ